MNDVPQRKSLVVGVPPGAEPYGDELVARLEGAFKAKGKGYRPRTRHLQKDGRPKYTNRLLLEPSPYLLQHAHNPVDWFPWGDEAFEQAKMLGRPVFLSIGYSTCHWCYVMEEESFEDEEIARYLNEHYVAIKVDREERSDVDAIYMTAVQALTGHAGWPMSVWLAPERRPYCKVHTKFPSQLPIRFLLRIFRRTKDERALHMAKLTLKKMAAGGMYDHVGGGFHRYSTDPRWQVPHFEKMLYDNALLAVAYLEGYVATDEEDFQEELIVREKPAYDGAEPSGSSVHALTLLRLWALTGDESYRMRAERTFEALGEVLMSSPAALSGMLLALDFFTDRARQIVLVAPTDLVETEPFLDVLRRRFVPNKVLVQAVEAEIPDLSHRLPIVEGKLAQGKTATAYVCELGACERPTTDPLTFEKQLEETKPL